MPSIHSVLWEAIGRSQFGEFESPHGRVQFTVYRERGRDQVVVLDNGSICKFSADIPPALQRWHFRDGVFFRECSEQQVDNAVNELVQACGL